MVIKEFKGRYRFLSNFFKSPFKINGILYNTVEHWFQSQKAITLKEQEYVRCAKTPADAKKRGRKITKRDDWENIKLQVMEKGVRAKFNQNAFLAKKLLATRNKLLQEGNSWGDAYWGVDLHSNKGENHLGIILMKIRKELRKK